MSHFEPSGTHLERYARRFSAVEINSSFHRSHRPGTYQRWADSVPETFRFSVKIPKVITHERKLVDVLEPLDSFLGEVQHLGRKLGCLLVQLPPKLEFDAAAATAFLAHLRERFAGEVVTEPRHVSWFSPEADALLVQHRVARVAADPAPIPGADKPGGYHSPAYYRLHGSPRMYYSSYSGDFLAHLGATLQRESAHRDCWCIFDNTAAGAALPNALALDVYLADSPLRP